MKSDINHIQSWHIGRAKKPIWGKQELELFLSIFDLEFFQCTYLQDNTVFYPFYVVMYVFISLAVANSSIQV